MLYYVSHRCRTPLLPRRLLSRGGVHGHRLYAFLLYRAVFLEADTLIGSDATYGFCAFARYYNTCASPQHFAAWLRTKFKSYDYRGGDMERPLILAILLLLLATSVSAATGDYYVVVGEDSPASDVITGANFAASMKGSVAVTFQSAIDKDLYPELSSSTMKYQLFVVIDGNDITIVGGNKGDAWDAAKLYFERKGFDVKEISSGYTPADVLLESLPEVTPGSDDTDSSDDDVKIELPDLEDEDVTAPLDEVDSILAVDDTQDDSPDDSVRSVEPTPEPKPGVFRRFWGWLSGIFD